VTDFDENKSFNTSDEGTPELDLGAKVMIDRMRRMAGRHLNPY